MPKRRDWRSLRHGRADCSEVAVLRIRKLILLLLSNSGTTPQPPAGRGKKDSYSYSQEPLEKSSCGILISRLLFSSGLVGRKYK